MEERGGPGTGDYMAWIARCYAAAWHAAHGGNWELAAYFVRRVRGIQRRLAVAREKYRAQLDEFDADVLTPLLASADSRDLAAFDRAYERGIERANHYHVLNDKPYIRWRHPDAAPPDLDLGPAGGR